MAKKKHKKKFDQESCDVMYHVSCAADTNCADECDMRCPYVKKNKENK